MYEKCNKILLDHTTNTMNSENILEKTQIVFI